MRTRFRFVPSTLALLALAACSSASHSVTSQAAASAGVDAPSARGGGDTPLPAETQRLWDAYTASLAGVPLQDGCSPIQMKAKGPSKGLVVIYHGFTGCPIQFINMGRELADQGYQVLLPLLPGNGRVPTVDTARIASLEASRHEPIAQIVTEDPSTANVIKDDYSGIPLTVQPYYDYAAQMTAIAKSYPGPRLLGGLSLGGGVAVATLIAGADMRDAGEPNVWARGLFMSPFFRAPSIEGNAAPVVGASAPSFGFGFGANCKSGQLSPGYAKRIGICDFAIGNVSTLEKLGAEIGQKAQMQKIQVPVQVIGVANDNTADVTAIINAFSFTDPSKTATCFFPDDVSHAIFYDGDFVPLEPAAEAAAATARDVNAVPRVARYWARYAQDRAVDFLVNGFDGNGGPFVLDGKPSTEKNPAAKACALPVSLDDVVAQNRALCQGGKGLAQYCQDLDKLVAAECDPKAVAKLPDGNAHKAYCAASH